MKIANCTINAYIPVCVRNSNEINISKFEVKFEGTNNFTTHSAYHVAIAQEEFDDNKTTPTKFADGIITVTGANEDWYIYK